LELQRLEGSRVRRQPEIIRVAVWESERKGWGLLGLLATGHNETGLLAAKLLLGDFQKLLFGYPTTNITGVS